MAKYHLFNLKMKEKSPARIFKPGMKTGMLFLMALSSHFVSSRYSYSEPRSNHSTKNPSDKGLALMDANCFACHSPDAPGNGKRIAPPMYKIREHYFQTGGDRETFMRKIISYVNNPTESNSIMPGAVRNFGVMPKLSYKEDDLREIAGYMYDQDLSSDEWYSKWKNYKATKAGTTGQTPASYEDIGRNAVNQTKSVLGKNLLAAIQEKGAAHALQFCNTRAIPLTDSMSLALNVKIRRVSDKPRNPQNRANAEETNFINELKLARSAGKALQPRVAEKNGKMIGYYAIETNAMCLQCHGTPGKNILPETMEAIRKNYPRDLATGYAENEIRGIFVVEMNKK